MKNIQGAPSVLENLNLGEVRGEVFGPHSEMLRAYSCIQELLLLISGQYMSFKRIKPGLQQLARQAPYQWYYLWGPWAEFC